MKKTNNSVILHRINDVIGRKKIYIGILLLVQMLLGISSVLYAIILKHLIDAAVDENSQSFFVGVVTLVTLVCAQILIRATNRFFEEFARATMENQWKERLFSILLSRDFASVSGVHSGEWMNRLTSDTIIVADGLVQIIPGMAGMLVKLVGAVSMLLILQPDFGYLITFGGAILLLLTYGFRKVLKVLHKHVQEADGELRVYLQERLSSMLVIRAFGKEEQTLQGASDRMKLHKKARMRKNHFSNLCNVGFGGVMQGTYVLGAAVCGYGILTGGITYGTMTATLQLIGQIQSPFANVTGYLPKYYAMLASAERLIEAERYPDEESPVKEFQSEEYSGGEYFDKKCSDGDDPAELLGSFRSTAILSGNRYTQRKQLPSRDIKTFYDRYFKAITLEQVEFTYQKSLEALGSAMPVVLKDVNLGISKGDYVAFTGPSGCGKSTLLKLLLCLYPLDAGNRWIELKDSNRGEPPNEKYDLYHRILLTPEFRSLFAYVPQGNHLMSGTIREIMTFSEKAAMQEEDRIWKALQIACADTFVKELFYGIDTPLGERGAGLSEGQMQRIAIARAIFSDNPILILDESTSALDEVVEGQMLANLRAMTDKTVLIVTHRTAAFNICNKEIAFTEENVTVRSLL